jgi:hypothetical protein
VEASEILQPYQVSYSDESHSWVVADLVHGKAVAAMDICDYERADEARQAAVYEAAWLIANRINNRPWG